MDAIFDGSLSGGTLALLFLCLFVALGFEFVNGFHDTANAVATVIYTKTLKPTVAVVFSGICNFIGVFLGGIGVAIAIVRLLPVDLLVLSGVGRGLAMTLALLLSAMIWNIGTWWKGLPASSSHTLIGAIMGVGMANAAMNGNAGGGINWHKAIEVGEALLLSPLLGFGMAAGLLWLMHRVIANKAVFRAPDGDVPPPGWIRALLVMTCGGVSFAHGSNDGQKGVGLIMLILVGLVPAGFALNLDAPLAQIEEARQAASAMQTHLADSDAGCVDSNGSDSNGPDSSDEPACVASRELGRIVTVLEGAESVRAIPADARWSFREAVLRLDEALNGMESAGAPAESIARLRADRARISPLTEYAPPWVIMAVALSLGIGTMVGWKRIVVTVGEKIGKTHLTYGQGAAAELVAMITIFMASVFHQPVSTTHVLSSGIAGTMAVEGSGLQADTVRNIVLAWVLTLPAAILISAILFWIFAALIG